MQKINNYILEKLHINKDTKLPEVNLKKGDFILFMQINKDSFFIEPTKLEEYIPADSRIVIKADNGSYYITRDDVFINVNNVIEVRDDSIAEIFLYKQKALDFLDLLEDNDYLITGKDLKPYFESDKAIHYYGNYDISKNYISKQINEWRKLFK